MPVEKNPVVSIITSVYNTDSILVRRAIQSAMAQDFKEFEIMLIDDGSREELARELRALARSHADRITLICHPNQGQSESINRGIRHSRAPYIAFLDADDEYKPEHLSSCLREMARYDLIASTAEVVVDHRDQYFLPDKNNRHKLVHVDDCILFATLFGKREVFEEIDFAGSYGADARFFEEAGKRYRVAKLDLRTYVYYRNIPGSITTMAKEAEQGG